jgi:hypothetical protein
MQDPSYNPAMAYPDPIRIFCGADRSQWLAWRVFEFSVRRHTARQVEVALIDNALAPLPADPRYAPYTEFSFARFAIPAICGHQGHAVYMDSDMLVFADIGELWDTPMDGARIAIEKGARAATEVGKHAAVMLLDCAALAWDVKEIVAGLGTKYEYKPLMQIDPLLAPGEMRELIPSGWNDLDAYRPGITRNLHYSRIKTQPWVHAGHPDGAVWVNELRRMLEGGAIEGERIREEVREGYARPSLLVELGIDPVPAGVDRNDAASLRAFDAAQGFVPHRKLVARVQERRRAVARLERDAAIAKAPWLGWWHRARHRWRHGGD